MNDAPQSFGRFLYHRRMVLGFKVNDVCHACRIDEGLLRALERDEVARFPVWRKLRPALRKMASLYGVDEDEFIEEFTVDAEANGYDFTDDPVEEEGTAMGAHSVSRRRTAPPSPFSLGRVVSMGGIVGIVVAFAVITTGIIKWQDANRVDPHELQRAHAEEHVRLRVSLTATARSRLAVSLDDGVTMEMLLRPGVTEHLTARRVVEIEAQNDRSFSLIVNGRDVRFENTNGGRRHFIVESGPRPPEFEIRDLTTVARASEEQTR